MGGGTPDLLSNRMLDQHQMAAREAADLAANIDPLGSTGGSLASSNVSKRRVANQARQSAETSQLLATCDSDPFVTRWGKQLMKVRLGGV